MEPTTGYGDVLPGGAISANIRISPSREIPTNHLPQFSNLGVGLYDPFGRTGLACALAPHAPASGAGGCHPAATGGSDTTGEIGGDATTRALSVASSLVVHLLMRDQLIKRPVWAGPA